MMFPKHEYIHSKNLRASAHGEDCTLEIIGICNSNPETTVLCHLPDESKGGSLKADDISACYGCMDCHDEIDQRTNRAHLTSYDREWYMRRALTRTIRRMVQKGVLKT